MKVQVTVTRTDSRLITKIKSENGELSKEIDYSVFGGQNFIPGGTSPPRRSREGRANVGNPAPLRTETGSFDLDRRSPRWAKWYRHDSARYRDVYDGDDGVCFDRRIYTGKGYETPGGEGNTSEKIPGPHLYTHLSEMEDDFLLDLLNDLH
jgi:hypothetical protein